MARTYRKDHRESKAIRDGDRNSCYYRKENKEIRVRHARDVRHTTRQALHQEDYDDLPDYPHTSGWETN